MAGAADFGEVIRRDPSSRLHFIPAGSGDEAGRQYALAMVVDALAHTYDFVVFVTGAAANALSLAPMFDKILLRVADPESHELFDALIKVCKDVSLVEDAGGAPVAA